MPDEVLTIEEVAALLKLGRFRGTKIAGDILDNKQEYLHAFVMVREAIGWIDRTLPLSTRFPPGAVNREDRAHEPDQVPGASSRAAPRRRPRRDDDPRQAPEPEAAVSHDRGGARSPRDHQEGMNQRRACASRPRRTGQHE
jgi:hypothetical protein